MVKDKLVIDEYNGVFVIRWDCWSDGSWDRGSHVGEGLQDAKKLEGVEPEDRSEWEFMKAELLAEQYCKEHEDDVSRVAGGYWMFKSYSHAKACLKYIQAGFCVERELPEWAKKALEAGWKPPKGWKA